MHASAGLWHDSRRRTATRQKQTTCKRSPLPMVENDGASLIAKASCETCACMPDQILSPYTLNNLVDVEACKRMLLWNLSESKLACVIFIWRKQQHAATPYECQLEQPCGPSRTHVGGGLGPVRIDSRATW